MKYKLKTDQAFLYFILYFVIYRLMFFHGQFLPNNYSFIAQYFAAGLLLDTSLLFLIFYLFSFRATYFAGYLIALTFISLNLINIALTQIYASGLVSFSHLIDYATDFLPLIQTGSSLVSFYSIFFLIIFPITNLIFSDKRKFLFQINFPVIIDKKIIKKNIPLIGLFVSILLSSLILNLDRHMKKYSNSILASNIIYRMINYELEAYNKKIKYTLLAGGLEEKQFSYPDKVYFEKRGYQFRDPNFPLAKYPPNERRNPRVKPNIIMIIMESVAAKDTGFQKYNKLPGRNVTPFLNSLMPKSVIVTHFFSNADYTAGAETAAICSTHDTLHYMVGDGSILRNFTYTNLRCLPQIFLELGYSTSFFHSYTAVFDNKYIFFPLNGVQDVVDRDHEALAGFKQTFWGIPDHEMFRYGVDYLSKIKKPFFSIFLTVNNHPPFILHDKSKEIDFGESPQYNAYLNTVRQTDDSIRLFIEKASKKDWYENTIFVITSDNGTALSKDDLKETGWRSFKMLHLVPFLVYNPKQKFGLKPKALTLKAASHIDIPPTILDIIGMDIPNPFTGESLFLKGRREYTLIYTWFRHYYRLSWPYLYHNTDHQMLNLQKEEKINSNKIAEYKKWLEGNLDILNYTIYKNKIWPKLH